MNADDHLRLLAPLGAVQISIDPDGRVRAAIPACIVHDRELTRAFNHVRRDPANWQRRPAPGLGVQVRPDIAARYDGAARPLAGTGTDLADALGTLFNMAVRTGAMVVRAYDRPGRRSREPERAHETLVYDHHGQAWKKAALPGPFAP